MIEVKRIVDLLAHCKAQFDGAMLVAGKQGGQWTTYEVKEWTALVDQLSKGLLAFGIKKGDHVAIMATNCPEWNIIDFAVCQLGAIIVPLYPTLSDADLDYILEDANVKLLFIGDQLLLEKTKAAMQKKNLDLPYYTINETQGAPHWKKLITPGLSSEAIALEPYRDAVDEMDCLTLIYTSGTTGRPKGVPLTHRNLITNFKDCASLLPVGYERAISFLPLSHIFERMVVYLYFYKGISIYYAENMDTIIRDMQEIRPHGFTTVPRVLEKVYDKIEEKGESQKGWKRSVFLWAIHLGLLYQEAGKNSWWYRIKLAVARKLVFNKWKAALGGKIVTIICGGAALQVRLARIFWAAQIPVLEGYGLTETSPVIAVNTLAPNGQQFGTVGRVLDGVQVKIAQDGEVLCKGPSIFSGYYKNKEASQDAFDPDGYFKTGDIGALTAEGFLRITDRKKEMFKTAGGKYVAPQLLENKLLASRLIAQVMVLGEGRKFPAALIVPAFDELKKWTRSKGISQDMDLAALLRFQPVTDRYQDIIEAANRDFGHWEQVKKFVLLTEEWTISKGELTPKLSLKRKLIAEKNKELIDALYTEHPEVNKTD